MADQQTTCPECGYLSADPEWCEHCGASLAAPPPSTTGGGKEWLEPGDSVEVACTLEPGRAPVTLQLTIESLLDASTVRRVGLARVTRGDASGHRRFIVEEFSVSLSDDDASGDPALARVMRVPVGRTTRGEHQLRVYHDQGLVSLEELVMSAHAELDYETLKYTFSSILDAVEALHDRGLMYLRLSPWTVRVRPQLLVEESEVYVSDAVEPRDDMLADELLGHLSTAPQGHPAVEEATAEMDVPERVRSAGEETTAGVLSETDAYDEDEPPALIGERETLDALPPLDANGDFTHELTPAQLQAALEDDAALAALLPSPETEAPAEDASDEHASETPVEGDADEAPSSEDAPAQDADAPAEVDEDETLEAAAPDDAPAQDAQVDAPADEAPADTTLDFEPRLERPHPSVIALEPSVAPYETTLEEDTNPEIFRPRALLDGGFPVFQVGERPEDMPIVMGFSAPEMFGRARAEIDARGDIFALGMLLYYMVAGELPPTSMYTRQAPALPARNFRPEFHIGLGPVISRATRPDPRDRFSDVESLRSAFNNACTHIEQRIHAQRSRRPLRLRVAVDRHIGTAKGKRNPTNQDHVFSKTSRDERFGLIVVADGVSTASYGSGDLASKSLIDAAERVWAEVLPAYEQRQMPDPIYMIQRTLKLGNDQIVQYVNEHCRPFRGNPHEVMGSTALVAVVHNGQVTLGSLGDSRAYLQRGPGMEQITIDHNLWTLSILDGVAADSAMALPHSEALARCLGTFYIESESLVPVDPQPDMFRFPVAPGDTLLMTTDGLIDFAGTNPLTSEDNILGLLLSEPDPALACLELILLANRGGGGDNIGIGIVKFY